MSIPILSWPADPEARVRRLADALPPERLSLLRTVADEAAARGLPLYIVGGFVRDLLLGRPATDFDLVVEGDAISFARSLTGKYGGKITGHSKFGTAIWTLNVSTFERLHIGTSERGNVERDNVRTLDFISARSETYKHPAALPTVRPGKWTDDLRRRDFSINTLALRLDGEHFGELRDGLGGLDDLRRGLVRVLHPRSFVDDPTRIFRAVRYEQRLGFEIDAETLALIPDALPLVDKLSAERVRHELDLILEEENAAGMLKRLAGLNALASVHPALAWDASIRKRFESGRGLSPAERKNTGWMLWLMHLPRADLEQIDRRLHFHAGLRDEIFSASALRSGLDALAGKKPSECVAALNGFPLAAVRAVALAASRGEARRNLQNYIETWRHVKPKATGHTLKKLGLEPGPVYQSILLKLKNAWLDGDIQTDREEKKLLEKAILKTLPPDL